ncbi:MAG: hypothetical protein A2Z45_02805 [Chloroflexi bacterium RBG_19FT_COMBO_55_16]|nr:MAG: hypothetical protein A2Z45_02805 [Chloroflexi bacterium RBG_19FT_COMBO_55_16]
MIPERIGRYEIKAEIGRGGMATVYHAHDPRFKRDVAVKVLPPQFLHDPTFRARFEREAQIIAAIEHPAIVPVYDFGEEIGQPYLVMRYMSGGTLSDRLDEGWIPLNEVAHIFSRLAPALDEVHRRGIIHRDLKPSNILFDQYGEAYLTDFGIARMTESASTLTGSNIVGTPAYMSPEQARGDGELDNRSDIYALGAILFEMLTGKQPYQATTPMGVVLKHLSDPVPRLREVKADLPDDYEAIIAKAMAKERTQRFSSVAEMAGSLETIARQPASPAVERGQGKPQAKPAKPGAAGQPAPLAELRESAGRAGPAPDLPRPKGRARLPVWAWLLGGLIALAGLCGLVGLLLTGGNLMFGPSPQPTAPPTLPEVSVTQALAPPTEAAELTEVTVFRDDFSDPSSGWNRSFDAGSQTDYAAGGYRIYVDQPDRMYWANPGRIFEAVSIQVEADKIAGADDNFFGILCRYQDPDNFYLLAISSDGFYQIGKYKDGEYSVIKNGEGYSNSIHQGKTRNQLRAECIRTTLRLYVNDSKLAEVEDTDFSRGDIGLMAAALDVAGTNILFDNFVAQIP